MSVANSLYSNDGSTAADVRPSLTETTVEPPSRQLQPPKGSGEDTTDAFDLVNNSAQSVSIPGQEINAEGAFQQSFDVFANKSTISVPEIDEQTPADEQDEAQARCSTKCAIEFQVIDDTLLIDSPLLGNAKLNNGVDGTQRQEIENKKAKRPRRRGGKARKNKVILEIYPIVNKEKKGHQYSRHEMEVLRFDELDEQKKRWVEVYCGLSPLVQEEYDGLVELCKTRKEDSVPSFDFDPRLQFQKSADLVADNQSITSDPSSLPISDEVGGSAEEEEYIEDDDSDEDYSSIQRPAFLVTGEPDFDSGPPLDGLEYLRRVRWEADRVPKVSVVKVNKIKEQSVYMPQIPDIMKCPENLLPLKQWEDSFLAEFSELRLVHFYMHVYIFSCMSMHRKEDISGQILETNTFDNFITLTSTEASCALETSDEAKKVNPNPVENPSFTVDLPTLSKILKMDSAARTSMLKRRISSVENMSTLPHDDVLWLFALCAAVDCPLDADTSAALRCLLRKCASLRAAKNEVDDEVVSLNILVTISGRYFGQLES
ncbi:gem-associated protein 2 [Phtheirospermum japonicum]|uniref:Gem-associated protein 2 n=1 Tax=Phtheirospermum japonicum TaxID=374723 RepID=A0A830D2R4_9LAMI|nr:gem-associated protein 2 [Phtheirospermum japonicum]